MFICTPGTCTHVHVDTCLSAFLSLDHEPSSIRSSDGRLDGCLGQCSLEVAGEQREKCVLVCAALPPMSAAPSSETRPGGKAFSETSPGGEEASFKEASLSEAS